MLISTGPDLVRLQCAFIDTPEVEKICDFIGSQRHIQKHLCYQNILATMKELEMIFDLENRDALFDDACTFSSKSTNRKHI